MKLAGKVIVITGGSQGIGEAIARRCAREGARVAVVASTDCAKAQAVADGISRAEGVARGYACDVREPRHLERLVADVERDLGPVDILVNSAGVFYPTPAGETPPEPIDRMIDINLKGAWNGISAVVPGMKQRRRGKIICMASVAASYGVPSFAMYCATKAAVAQLVRALALELAPHGIQINAIAPGNTATPMNAAVREDAAAVQALTAATPTGRAFSNVDDIAALALFLASDDSRAMHGACVVADEGISLGLVAR